MFFSFTIMCLLRFVDNEVAKCFLFKVSPFDSHFLVSLLLCQSSHATSELPLFRTALSLWLCLIHPDAVFLVEVLSIGGAR